MGLDVCRWPISANVSLMVHPYFTFMKSAPNSNSTADDATNFKIAHRVKIALLSVMCSPYLGTERRKKFPDAKLLALFAER